MSIQATYLTQADIDLIEEAITLSATNGIKIWDQECIKSVKRKIKNFIRALVEDRCCYCCKNFHGEFNMVIDIEHVLPKSKYLQFEFSPFNVSIACKRCNMNVKNEDDSFLHDPQDIQNNPEDKDNYMFIHPNLDNYFDHLNYDVIISNNQKMIKYTVKSNSSKGTYTYSYFKLIELEVDSFSKAQGVNIQPKKYSELLDDEDVQQIELLLNDLK